MLQINPQFKKKKKALHHLLIDQLTVKSVTSSQELLADGHF